MVAASLFTHGAPETFQIPPVTESLACRLATARAHSRPESIRYASSQGQENAINGSSQLPADKMPLFESSVKSFPFFMTWGGGDNEVPFLFKQKVRGKGGTLSISVKQSTLMGGGCIGHSEEKHTKQNPEAAVGGVLVGVTQIKRNAPSKADDSR